MKKIAIAAALLLGAVVVAGPIHSWSVGEYITSTDLNAALTHLHNSVGHGHGPILTNADMSSNAAIAHSKLATPALLPKVWGSVTATCATPATCTMVDESGLASIAGQATTGEYLVTYDAARGSTSYGTLVTVYGGTADLACHVTAQTTTTATVRCITASTGADADAAFTFLLLDTEN